MSDDVDKTALLIAVLRHYGFDRVPEHGGNRSILCALHGDTTKSASVHPDKGVYLCFTCGISGDGYSIIMNQEGVDFAHAVTFAEERLDLSSGQVSRGDHAGSGYLPGRPRRQRRERGGVPAWRRYGS